VVPDAGGRFSGVIKVGQRHRLTNLFRILPIMRFLSGKPDNTAGLAASDSCLDMPRLQLQAIRNWTQITPSKQAKALNGFQLSHLAW
jgi:hypothetical protein